MSDETTREQLRAREVCATEDSLAAFVRSLDAHQAAALYELLYQHGYRFTGRALSDWRRKGGGR